MKRAIAILIGAVTVAVFFGHAQSGPRFYFGTECLAENAKGDHPTGMAAGIVLEGKAGKFISANIVCADRPAAFRAFARALQGPKGRQLTWSNKRRGSRGTFRATWEFFNNGERCRDFAQETQTHGRRQVAQGTACLQADGNWHLH